MKMRLNDLRRLIREVIINEVDISEVTDTCYVAGSTHVMQTCKIGGDKYFLKFSDEYSFGSTDPSLQVLVEYLAYRIYGLYSGIKIPKPQLVYDKAKKRVGLATTPVEGEQALRAGTDPKLLGKMMSQGVYVDVFLANWDVVGMGSGNVFISDKEVTRIDPGGALTFRAQGGRKNKAFGPEVGELETMLGGSMGAGFFYRHADLKVAAVEFLGVSWESIAAEIDAVQAEVAAELQDRKMSKLVKQWASDVEQIKSTLALRHKEVAAHANLQLKIGKTTMKKSASAKKR